MKVLFIGFGNVAKEMARILIDEHLYPNLKLPVTVIGIYTGRHGGIEDAGGLDLAKVLDNLKKQKALTENGARLSSLTPLEAAETLDYDVLVELSALSIEGKGEPAAPTSEQRSDGENLSLRQTKGRSHFTITSLPYSRKKITPNISLNLR